MWIGLNSIFYLNYSTFFKVPYVVASKENLNPFKLLYNTSIDKFFLLSNNEMQLIYLDKSETYNSYITSYLINDYLNYKSKLKPYISNSLYYLRTIQLNADVFIIYNFFTNYNFGSCVSFQTEDEKYVVCVVRKASNYKATTNWESFAAEALYVCDKIDFEDNILLLASNDSYVTDNLYSKSGGVLYYSDGINNSYASSICRRVDKADKDIPAYSHFYIKNNFKSDNTSSVYHHNIFPTWNRTGDYEYIFNISENLIPDDIPQVLTIAYDEWEIDFKFLGNYSYRLASFEDNYSSKEKIVRYGFFSSSNYPPIYNISTGSIMFVIEYSDELNGYKLFDINNPNAGYFLCSDINCLKEHTSYRFKAFLDEHIYKKNVVDYFKTNDLVISWIGLQKFKDFMYTDNYNKAYLYCVNNIKKLSTIYNVQIPFIRF